ncbi:cupin domain-containing protein [Pareuzebyella sediminis]|uniref:cupin domain-containing protein n=1 Tax=Pareuzebyella sediminis TaxID=2607998 RepID=UPI0011EFA623|nr:cupin domain-containing protein [Pareuzebyella sediminis]
MKFQSMLWPSILICTIGTSQLKEVETGVYKWNELPKKESPERISRKILEGYSPHFSFFEIHATTQAKGAKPAAPHTQKNIEELIVVKKGQMKMTIDGESKILSAGSVVLIPPLTEQSMENVGDGELTYYVIMFTANEPMDMERSKKAGHQLFLESSSLKSKETKKGSSTPYFERPSAMCKKFEMHATQLNGKGPSHEPHSHLDSELIIVLEGQTQMTINNKNYTGETGDVYFIRSNDFHGISNIGDQPCRYYAIRWH